MSRRQDSDEHYVIDLCDEVLGSAGVRQATFDWLLGDASPTTRRAKKLPVDAYWPDLKIAVEFQEKQHTQPVAIFDRRETVSGVPRGDQRRLYDLRKSEQLPLHGITLITIHKHEFVTKGDKIVRGSARDIQIIRTRLSA